VVGRVRGDLRLQFVHAGPALAGTRVGDALLERVDARLEIRVELHLRELRLRLIQPACLEEALRARKRELGLGGQELVEERPHLALGDRAHELRHRLAVLEGDDVGDRTDAEGLRELLVVVGVDLHELHAPRVVLGHLLEDRRERAAGPAPGRPEVGDDGSGLRGFEHLALKRGGRDVHPANVRLNESQFNPRARFLIWIKRARYRR
jgi:hypothetical protein